MRLRLVGKLNSYKILSKLQKVDLLILDDWGLE